MAGLITTKELLDENHQVICVERQASLGGVFNRDEQLGTTAYESLLLTVSNYAMAFSCFPPQPHEERRFWTVREYQRYLRRFADFYHLQDSIRFQTEALSIKRWKHNLWAVTLRQNGVTRQEICDAVAVCSGAFQTPKWPALPFLGNQPRAVQVIHASEFQHAAPYTGKRVLCLGMGESGADIVHEVACAADSTLLSVRRSPPPLVPRYDCEHIGPIPNDGETTRHRYGVFLNQFRSSYNQTDQHSWPAQANSALANFDNPYRYPNTEDPPLGPERDRRIAAFIAHWNRRSYAGGLPFVSRFLTKNTVFVRDVIDGRLGVSFSDLTTIDGHTCHFADGTTFEADIILCCTGYDERQNPLFAADPQLRDCFGDALDPRSLFKHCFHPAIGKSLALIGYARPTQGMLPACAELQARYFALLCSNRRTLPQDLHDCTLRESQAEAEMLKGDQRIRTLVQYPYFSESMAELIGCKPRLRTQLRDPVLAYKLFFGSMLATRYRLDGPHADPTTAKHVLKRLRVADTPANQWLLAALNWDKAYETLAHLTEWFDTLRAYRKGHPATGDPAFHAWGARQLRTSPPEQPPSTPQESDACTSSTAVAQAKHSGIN